jgi:Protein of unknown function (DUF3574)
MNGCCATADVSSVSFASNRMFRQIVLASAILITSCAGTREALVAPHRESCSASAGWVLDRLYFGTAIDAGGTVREEDWISFLDASVTPRFPDGLTFSRATGQWREDSGKVTHEATFILEIVHSSKPEADASLEKIRAEYKARFGQKSVLRITQPGNVCF